MLGCIQPTGKGRFSQVADKRNERLALLNVIDEKPKFRDRPEILKFITGERKFATKSNSKTQKNKKLALDSDWSDFLVNPQINLAQFNIMSIEVASTGRSCPWAKKENLECFTSGACLVGSGNGRFDPVMASRTDRLAVWLNDRALFMELLDRDLRIHHATSLALGLVPVVRIDTFSSLWLWNRPQFRQWFKDWIAAGVIFYDYAKAPLHIIKKAQAEIQGLDLTVSWHEKMHHLDVLDVLKWSRLAVPFDCPRGKPLPKSWRGIPVVDGDRHDLRFIEKTGIIVGLRSKVTSGGKLNVKNTTGFIQPAGYVGKSSKEISLKAPNPFNWQLINCWDNPQDPIWHEVQ